MRQGRKYSKKAIYLINKYLRKSNRFLNRNDINKLIIAGNMAGQAIAITETNVVHAASYPITIEYGIDHGTACGMVLPYFVGYMNFGKLPKLFNLDSTQKLAALLRESFIPPKIKNFNVQKISDETMKYDKINASPRRIDRKSLIKILLKLK